MTNMQLLEAIGMLSEDIIADADMPVAKRAKVLPWRQIGTVAACLCIAVGVFLVPLVGRQMRASDGSDAVTQMGTTVAIEPTDTGAPYEPGTTAIPEWTTSEPEWDTSAPIHTTTTPRATMTHAPETTCAAPTQSQATSTVHGTSEPGTECIGPSEKVLIYEQNFNDLSDTTDQAIIMEQLGLTADALQPKENSTSSYYGAYSTSNVFFAIEDGRLYIDNHDETPTEGRGQDAYFRIAALNDDYMKPIAICKYTLEYELEYVTAANNAYVTLITEYSPDHQCYNIFALHPDGSALHACHFYDMWKYFTKENAVIPATALTEKLTGIRTDTEQPLRNVRETVRLQWDPEWGHTVYLKTSSMADFVKVFEPIKTSEGVMYLGWDGWAVALKVGGAVDAYIDNIRIWTGWKELAE